MYDCVSFGQRKTAILIPKAFSQVPIAKLIENKDNCNDTPFTMQNQTNDFIELVHVSLKLRADILSHPKYTGISVNEDEIISCIPENLFVFLKVMFGGQNVLCNGDDNEKGDESSLKKQESNVQQRILSIAQDLVYNVSGGRHWMPKHVGLASTLHQATRSKDLVELFHNAGISLSYHNVKQIDTSLAESTLSTQDEDGSVVPPNLVPGRFVHFHATT